MFDRRLIDVRAFPVPNVRTLTRNYCSKSLMPKDRRGPLSTKFHGSVSSSSGLRLQHLTEKSILSRKERLKDRIAKRVERRNNALLGEAQVFTEDADVFMLYDGADDGEWVDEQPQDDHDLNDVVDSMLRYARAFYAPISADDVAGATQGKMCAREEIVESA